MSMFAETCICLRLLCCSNARTSLVLQMDDEDFMVMYGDNFGMWSAAQICTKFWNRDSALNWCTHKVFCQSFEINVQSECFSTGANTM